MRKKILSGILVLAMMLTMIPTAFAANGGKFEVEIDTTNADILDARGDTALNVTLDKTAKNGDTTTYNYVVKGNVYYKGTVSDVFGASAAADGFFVPVKLTVPTDWVSADSSNNKLDINHKIVVEQGSTKKTFNPVNDGFFFDHNDTSVTLLFKVDPADVDSKSAKMTVQYTTEDNDVGELDATEIYNFDLSKVTFMPQKATATLTVDKTGSATSINVSGGTAYYFLTDKSVDDDLGKLTYANTLSDVEAKLGTGVKSYIATSADNGKYICAVVVDEAKHVFAYSNSTLISSVTNAKSNNITVVMDKNVVDEIEVFEYDDDNTNWKVSATGTVSANGGKQAVTYDASKSNKVKLDVTAQDNCTVTSVTVKDAKGNTITVTEDSGDYIFVMPNADVTVTVTGEEKNDFSIKSGSEDVTVTVDSATATEKTTKVKVEGTLNWNSTKWELPLLVDLNKSNISGTVTAVVTIDGTTSSTQSNVADGIFNAAAGWNVELTTVAKTVKIEIKENTTVIKTYELDVSGVNFAKAASAVTATNGAATIGTSSTTSNVDGDELVIPVTSTGATKLNITIEKAALTAIDAGNVENVTLRTELGTITIDSKTVEKLVATNGDVTLVIAPSAGAEGLGGAKGSTVVEVAFKDANGKEIKIKDVEITLSVNFGITKSVLSAMGNVAVSYTDGKDSGVVTTITDKDIAADGTVTFTTTHLTLFYITTGTSTPSKPSTPSIPTIPGNVPGSTIVTPGKTEDNTENDLSMSYDDAVAYVAEMTDVNEDSWFYDAVVSAVQNGIIRGTSTTTFAPNSNMTLLQTLTVLARFDGQNVDGANWDKDALAWAVETGMIDKAENESDISRERLVYMLYKFAKASGVDVSNKGDLKAFPDAADVSDWAVEAMTWAVSEGIISGIYGELKPADTTTRAQVVTVLTRYADVIAD